MIKLKFLLFFSLSGLIVRKMFLIKDDLKFSQNILKFSQRREIM